MPFRETIPNREYDKFRNLYGETVVATLGVTQSYGEAAVLEGRGFIASRPFGIVFTGTAEQGLALLRNPGGSGKQARIYLHRSITNTGIAPITTITRVYSGPTITAVGTAIAPKSASIGSGLVSSLLFYSQPTYSALGTRVRTAINKSELTSPGDPFPFPYLLIPGQDILFTVQNDKNNSDVSFEILYIEEPVT